MFAASLTAVVCLFAGWDCACCEVDHGELWSRCNSSRRSRRRGLVDAQPHTDPEEIRELLVQQVVNPVRWEASMRYLLDEGYDLFYEVGPGRVLRGLMKRIHRKTKCEGVEV